MKKLRWSGLLLGVLLMTPQSAMIMQVTLEEDVSEKLLEQIARMTFFNDSLKLQSGDTYALDDIVKITFYDDGSSTNNRANDYPRASAAPSSFRRLSIRRAGAALQIGLPQAGRLEVLLCNARGQIVERAFEGSAEAGELRLPLRSMAGSSGFHGIIVKMNNELFVTKSIHVKGD
jgi:hypothetical protein